jgi:hypothetical protein
MFISFSCISIFEMLIHVIAKTQKWTEFRPKKAAPDGIDPYTNVVLKSHDLSPSFHISVSIYIVGVF